MYDLPTSIITENGEEYNIRNNGDYRMVLDCLGVLDDEQLKPLERIYASLIIFYDDFNDIDNVQEHQDVVEELLEKMFAFFNLNEEVDKSQKEKPKLVDWKEDSALIISAINSVAGKEVRAEEYVHWWTFIGYYMAIGECSLTTVVSIRNKIYKNKKLEKHEKEFRAENPKYFRMDMRTKAQKASDEWARSIWNSQ